MTKETVKAEKASVYEVGYHIVPAVSPENLPKEVDAIKAILGANGATIISEEAPAMRSLAYTMVKAVGQARHKYDTAYFGWIKFESDADAAVEIKRALDGLEKILRFILIKTVRENTIYGPKVLPKNDEEETEADDASDDLPDDSSDNEDDKDEESGDDKESSKEDLDDSIDKLVV